MLVVSVGMHRHRGQFFIMSPYRGVYCFELESPPIPNNRVSPQDPGIYPPGPLATHTVFELLK